MVAPHLNKPNGFQTPGARNHTSHQQLQQAQKHGARGLGGMKEWCVRQVLFPSHPDNCLVHLPAAAVSWMLAQAGEEKPDVPTEGTSLQPLKEWQLLEGNCPFPAVISNL